VRRGIAARCSVLGRIDSGDLRSPGQSLWPHPGSGNQGQPSHWTRDTSPTSAEKYL